MATGKLLFRYGTMAAGKSLHLLAIAHQLKENGIKYQLIKPKTDTRTKNTIKSRVGIEEECTLLGENESVFNVINNDIQWLLVDEAQFLNRNQVDELGFIVDNKNINIICYGLRTDFATNLFEGSKRLFEIADELKELVSYCKCGNKNSVNARFDENNNLVIDGEQIVIGDNEKYTSICRSCYHKLFSDSIPMTDECDVN